MNVILTAVEKLSGGLPDFLVHAPFAHPANITPFASLNPVLDYDFTLCGGKNAALFASRDKNETLGLIAAVIAEKPKSLSVFWPNDFGGKGLKAHLQKLGCEAYQDAKLHARIAHITNPLTARADVVAEWLAQAAAKPVPQTDMMAGAGLFSYRSVDAASQLLVQYLPDEIKGNVADFGCGWGYLSAFLLKQCPKITSLTAIDDDLRAVACTRDNIKDSRLETLHADIVRDTLPSRLDAVVMNPPFHIHGRENRALGQLFIERAAASLKTGGVLYMVANRHLPYEVPLSKLFAKVIPLADKQGFKVIAAEKGRN